MSNIRDFRQIHETVVRDVMDTFTSIMGWIDSVDTGDDKEILKGLLGKKDHYNHTSIAKATSDMTCTFPMLTSKGVSVDSASMVAKAMERKCVIMLQMVFNAYQITDKQNAIDFIRQYHANLDTRGFDPDDIGTAIDVFIDTANQMDQIGNINMNRLNALKEDMIRNTDFYLPDNLSEHSVNDYKVFTVNGQIRIVTEGSPNDIRVSPLPYHDINGRPRANDMQYDDFMSRYEKLRNEIEDQEYKTTIRPQQREKLNREIDKIVADIEKLNYDTTLRPQQREKLARDIEKTALDIDKTAAEIDRLNWERNNKRGRELTKMDIDIDRGRVDVEKSRIDAMKSYSDLVSKQIMNADIKKANELMPTVLNVCYTYKPEGGKDAIVVDNIMVGVKCKLYYTESFDIVSHIVSKTNDRNWITQFIRGTTREISFWKDFVLCIDRAKLDAMSLSSKSKTSKLWKTLERRSKNGKVRRAVGNGAGAVSAITTLCISQEEVELMKREFNIDVEKLPVARNLLDGYNLLCLVIVDESLEIAKFLFDESDPMWETISFNHLEREASDNAYKRVVNMMTKVSR